MAPLPLVPLANTIPAAGIILLCLGLAERDGVLIILGYAVTLLSALYIGAIAGDWRKPAAIRRRLTKPFSRCWVECSGNDVACRRVRLPMAAIRRTYWIACRHGPTVDLHPDCKRSGASHVD